MQDEHEMDLWNSAKSHGIGFVGFGIGFGDVDQFGGKVTDSQFRAILFFDV